MIIQALCSYYFRKSSDPAAGIAQKGFQDKEIPFVIVLNSSGEFIQIKDTRTQRGKKLQAQSFMVPQEEKRTAGIRANLLWDNAEYALGIGASDAEEKVKAKHVAFKRRIEDLDIQDEGIRALQRFLMDVPLRLLEKDPLFEELKDAKPIVSFQLDSDAKDLILSRKAVVRAIRCSAKASEVKGICLATGQEEPLARLQPSIKGVRDTNTTGGNIVSFNYPAFCSHGKLQGENAPLGEAASFAYTTALNYLLRKTSKQKLYIGNATVVFWSEKISTLESDFSCLFDEPTKDDPDRITDAVSALYKSVSTGSLPEIDRKNQFYVLGLAANAARISIRFWHVASIREMSGMVLKHFDDISIVHADFEPDCLSMWRILISTAVQNKSENISPKLAGDWMLAALSGKPYPDTVLQSVIRRIRSDREVRYARVAILKGYLNRKFLSEKEMTVSLDTDNENRGYRLGRLFAVLEKCQNEAHEGSLNSGIRDRYYASASSTPAVVFPVLMRLKAHHLRKLQHKKRDIFFERSITDIMSGMSDFPSYLPLSDQGRFAIGYYHQLQSFYAKKDVIKNDSEE